MSLTPMPRKPAPELTVPTLGGGLWSLQERSPKNFSLLVFYRGLHCPVCRSYLQTLTAMQDELAKRGIDILALSMDTEVRARKARMDWELGEFPLGFGLDAATARAWGLYLSTAIKDFELALFSEPGLFLVRPDGELYYVAINSSPFGRPHLPSILKNIDWLQETDYPARGEIP